MPDDIVLLDTDAWSLTVLSGRDRDPRVAEWRRQLVGRAVAIAAQTEAELRYGAATKGWGARLLQELEAGLARSTTIPVTAPVIQAWAALRASCKAQGLALADKQHMGDAWVAATAVAYDLPLLAGDGIYRGVAGLRLLA